MAGQKIYRVRRLSDGMVTEVLPRFFPHYEGSDEFEAWVEEPKPAPKAKPKTRKSTKARKSTPKPKDDK